MLEALIKLKLDVKGKYTVIINPLETQSYVRGVPDDLIDKGKLLMELRAVEPLKRLVSNIVCVTQHGLCR